MANTTWYGDGTATVAVGSRTVTGTDTGWLTEVAGLTPIKVGDKFGIHVGRPIVIEKIISNTELLLADDWPGPAQTNAPYKVELTSPTIAAVEAMRRLLAVIGNGSLPSLAELQPTENTFPYFTSPFVAALAALTPFSRSILDDASGAAMFATMGATSWGSGNNRGVKFPDGTILQVGLVTVTGGNLALTFPQAFPNVCYVVVASNAQEGADGTTIFAGWADVWSTSGFAGRGRFVNSGGMGPAGIQLGYIAVGR